MIIKETCYGCLVEGTKEDMTLLVNYLRKIEPFNIFSRKRGFFIGDPRICRRHRHGGPRLGYHFMEYEYELLDLISSGLKSIEDVKKIETKDKSDKQKKKVNPAIITELIEKIKSQEVS